MSTPSRSLYRLASRHPLMSKPDLARLQGAQIARPLLSKRALSISSQQLHNTSSFARSNFRPSFIRKALTHQTRSSTTLPISTFPSGRPQEDLQPAYQLTFTCKPCGHRSSHRVTKQGYHNGTVLIQCPGCKNRHVIADHLKVFLDQKSTLEDILKKQTQDGKPLTSLIKKGQLGIRHGSMVGNEGEEDIEFWEDGTETEHNKPASAT